MFENNKVLGFTLTELLIALTIIGAVAALSIPSLVDNLNKKQMVTQLKSTVESIQTLSGNQLAIKKSKSLIDTDFADPAKLLREKNFQIAQLCNTAADCWKERYKKLEDYSLTDRALSEDIDTGKTVILKNGSILTYTLKTDYPVMADKDQVLGLFRVDVNGSEKPNIIGRDLFWFLITKKGKIVDHYTANNKEYKQDKAISDCKDGSVISACFSELLRNNWVVEY